MSRVAFSSKAKEMTSLVNRNLHEVVDLSVDTFFDQVVRLLLFKLLRKWI